MPTHQQIDAALTKVEDAGAVTVRNAGRVQQSQTAPKDTLGVVAKAVKAYQASPEYLGMTKATGKPLNETDISGPMKEQLAGLAAGDQKRLLKLIHEYGEAAVLESIQKNTRPRGEY